MLTQEKLKELFTYNPITGVLVWKSTGAYRVKNGDLAGSNNKGYTRIKIGKYSYYSHRLIWLMEYGEEPKDKIDHINGNRSDNRLCNLRVGTNSQNLQNLKSCRKDSSTGVMGVKHSGNRFRADITVMGKRYFLGCFATKEEAHQTYLTKKRELHEFCTI